MKRDIEDIIKKIESELDDIYLSFDTANNLLGELNVKLDEQEIVPAGTSWNHLAADTNALRYRLWDNLTDDDKELLDTIIDILYTIEKQH